MKIQKIDKKCRCCAYRKDAAGGWTTCDYIFIEDKPRPCPPGKDCTVWKSKKKYAKERSEARHRSYVEITEARKKKNKAYYEKNKEKVLEAQRKYRARKKAQKEVTT